MTELPEGIASWTTLPGPAAVLDAVRLRIERGHQIESGLLRTNLSQQERREVARLLGTKWDVSGKAVRIQDLAEALAEHGLTVRTLVELVNGAPIENKRADRAARRIDAENERAAVHESLLELGLHAPTVESWLTRERLPQPGTGELRAFVDNVRRVWERLPNNTGTHCRLAVFAAALFGDAHALDDDEPLGRACARLIAAEYGLERPKRGGRLWRAAWRAAGVLCDGVSSAVLVLNLPLRGPAHAARLAENSRGEPLWLSLRSLAGTLQASRCTVFVCENPTVLETAADALGQRCPPLLCTNGKANTATIDLVGMFDEAGCDIRVRADFDEDGFIIVNQIRSVAPRASLWRFDTASYATSLGLPTIPTPCANADEELARLRELYNEHRAAPVHEERLLDTLIADLGENRPSA